VSPPRRKKAPERGANARRRRVPQRDFWGSDPAGDDEVEFIRPAADPTVMLRSLSSPPLPGRETVAVHYFAAVAEKAASLAVALAAASELLDMDDYADVDDEDFEPA
jgi:hypothetical protein